METKTKVHDGIVGIIYLISVILTLTVNIQWAYLAGAVAVLQVLSMFTGFCPVYFILNKVMRGSEPGSATSKSL